MANRRSPPALDASGVEIKPGAIVSFELPGLRRRTLARVRVVGRSTVTCETSVGTAIRLPFEDLRVEVAHRWPMA